MCPHRKQPLRNYRGNYPARSGLGITLKWGSPLFWSPEENPTSTNGSSRAQTAQRFPPACWAAPGEVIAGLWEKGTFLGGTCPAVLALQGRLGPSVWPEKSRPCCPNTSDDNCWADTAASLWGLAPGAGRSLPAVRQLLGRPEGTAGRGRMLARRRASRSLEQLISWLLTEKRMWIGSYAGWKGKPGQKSVALEYLSGW